MLKDAFHSACAAAALGLPLCLWRLLYPASDWAALALLPLTVMLFFGSFLPGTALYRARLQAAVRPGSPLSAILTGRARAIAGALLFVLISLPLLAWQALVSGPVEIAILILLCLAAGIVFAAVQAWLLAHFHFAFARSWAMTLATWITALAFLPILAWANWNFAYHPGAIRTAGLGEAVMQALQALPPRRGWLAEILAPFYAYEAGKLWLVVQIGSSRWATILFSLDTALVGFIVARAAIVLTALAQTLNQGGDRP